MWNITSDDLQYAKDRLVGRRAAVEARYAGEKAALDTELAAIETLERAAAEFTQRHRAEDPEPALETALPAIAPSETAASETAPSAEGGSGGEEGGARDILKPGSRWRLHLGNRPLDPEGAAGGPSAAPSTSSPM